MNFSLSLDHYFSFFSFYHQLVTLHIIINIPLITLQHCWDYLFTLCCFLFIQQYCNQMPIRTQEKITEIYDIVRIIIFCIQSQHIPHNLIKRIYICYKSSTSNHLYLNHLENTLWINVFDIYWIFLFFSSFKGWLKN